MRNIKAQPRLVLVPRVDPQFSIHGEFTALLFVTVITKVTVLRNSDWPIIARIGSWKKYTVPAKSDISTDNVGYRWALDLLPGYENVIDNFPPHQACHYLFSCQLHLATNMTVFQLRWSQCPGVWPGHGVCQYLKVFAASYRSRENTHSSYHSSNRAGHLSFVFISLSPYWHIYNDDEHASTEYL